MNLGRNICGNWQRASRYEWLLTNGLGGFACGTAAGGHTRRYHGFLVASLTPPVERTLLVSKVDLAVQYLGLDTDLAANEFAGGAISGQGCVHLESFAVRDGIPIWRYAVADAYWNSGSSWPPAPTRAICAWNCCVHRRPCE